MSEILPEDFYSDNPPPRIVSVECEYKVDTPASNGDFITPSNRRKAGYPSLGDFSRSGARIYSDVGQLEYAAPESLGPEDAVISDFAGKLVMSDLVRVAEKRNTALYRSTGSFKEKGQTGNTTRGYHQNFISTETASRSEAFTHLLPLFLATSTWAGQGTLREDSFVMAQKIWAMGKEPVTFGYGIRTQSQSKPFITVRTDDDTVRGDWRRVEVMSEDGGQSPVVRLTALGAFSVLLRIAEHYDFISGKDTSQIRSKLTYSRLGQYFAGDTDFHKTATTTENKELSALDFQERLLELCESLSTEIALPADEIKALRLWRKIIDRLRNVDLPSGEFNGTDRLLDNVALYAYLFKRFNMEEVSIRNKEAMAAVFFWDRVEPEGGASRWWKENGFGLIDQAAVEHRKHNPPQTRAERRVAAIKKPDTKSVSWDKRKISDTRSESLGDAY